MIFPPYRVQIDGSANLLQRRSAHASHYFDTKERERSTTEVILQRFRGQLIMLDGGRDAGGDYGSPEAPVEMAAAAAGGGAPAGGGDDLDDEIPF